MGSPLYKNNLPKYRYLYGKTYTEVKTKRIEEISNNKDVIVTSAKYQAGLEELCTGWLRNKETMVKESTLTRYDRTVKKYILGYFEKQRMKNAKVLKCDFTDLFSPAPKDMYNIQASFFALT